MSWASNFEDFKRPATTLNAFGGRPPGRGRTPVGGGRRGGAGGPSAAGRIGAQLQLLGDGRDVQMIAELSPAVSVSKIIGVIIAKGQPRHFSSKKDSSSERYVFTFTLRDSPTDFINVTCWGSEQHIKELVSQYHIGQVVQLDHVDIQTKANDGSDEKFKPWTPSAYQLSLNETRGSMIPYTSWNVNDYLRLLQVPVKASNDFYTISDIITNGPALNGEIISILGIVRQVGQVRQMNSKSGQHLQKCDITLFDDSSPAFTLVLWDEELISLAQSWIPKESIIFAADVRVAYNDWKKTMLATAIAKTILTINPDTAEAHNLYHYSQSVDLDSEDFDMAAGDKDPAVPLADITTVYRLQQLKDLRLMQNTQNSAVYGIVYAFVSMFDIDNSPSSSVISTRCNQNCPSLPSGSLQPLDFVKFYDIRVALTDETGTLYGCFLAGEAAENMIGCSVEEFVRLNDAQRTGLKWNFLLERCKVYVKVSTLQNQEKRLPSVRILHCEVTNIKEAVDSLMH